MRKEKRSALMSRIRSKNTAPELIVRKYFHSLGFRFRLHDKNLPGEPDIKLPKYHTVVFIHGCFWHQHKKCADGHKPKSNIEYWDKKLSNNVNRDRKHKIDLVKLGWYVISIWECEVKNTAILEKYYKQIIRNFS